MIGPFLFFFNRTVIASPALFAFLHLYKPGKPGVAISTLSTGIASPLALLRHRRKRLRGSQ
jgi:hypothetical protein